jgi:hypothetical protein
MRTLIDPIYAAYPAFREQRSAAPADESALAFMERFARFIISLYEAEKRDELKPAFAIMEDGLASGDTAIQDAVVLGFFEALQNVASHRPYGAGVFRGYLAMKSGQAWEELNAAWEGKSTLAEVVAHERGVSLKTPWWRFLRRFRRRSPAEMLEQVENPELRAIIEGMTRERSKPE